MDLDSGPRRRTRPTSPMLDIVPPHFRLNRTAMERNKKAGLSPLPFVSETFVQRRYIRGRRAVDRLKCSPLWGTSPSIRQDLPLQRLADAAYMAAECARNKTGLAKPR